MSTSVKMQVIPRCDFCASAGSHKDAAYDAKTLQGPWAYMCQGHFEQNGLGRLGTGFGQRLVKDTQ